jgi:acyl dehydratase
VNNAIYHTLFEEARLHYFGEDTLDLLPPSLTFPFVLLRTDCWYIKSGKGGKKVFVDLKTTHLGHSSFNQLYRVREAKTNTVWCEASATLVCFDFDNNAKTIMDDKFRAAILAYEGPENVHDSKNPKQLSQRKRDISFKTNYDENKTLSIGQYAEITKKFEKKHIEAFADLSEDFNPLHLDEEFAKTTRFGRTIVHGHLVSSLISGLAGSTLPGSGTIYLGQTIQYKSPTFVGDTVTIRVEVTSIDDKKKIVKLRTTARNQNDTLLIDGEATLMVPAHKILSQNPAQSKL